MSQTIPAQDFDSYRWRNRLLLLYTEDLNNPEYRRQVSKLQEDPEALDERRLIVFTLLKDRFAKGLPLAEWTMEEWKVSEKVKTTGFYLELIGLDGGTKLTKQNSVPVSDLWALIDGMPMRRAELKNKGNP